MNTLLNQSLAACAAMFLAFTSIGAIVTVPPAHALSAATVVALA